MNIEEKPFNLRETLKEIFNVMLGDTIYDFYYEKIDFKEYEKQSKNCINLVRSLITNLSSYAVDAQILKNIRAEIMMMNHVMEEINEAKFTIQRYAELIQDHVACFQRAEEWINQLIGEENDR